VSRRAGASLVALAALALAAGPALAADPILPLAGVQPGMVGEARTVVQGTQIVSFPVTVINVERASGAPGGELILIRAEGSLMDETGGIAEGMSGSPVYVTGADGVARVIGAIAYGAGDAANVLGGVTPIEQMLRPLAGRSQHERAAAPERVRIVRDRAAARVLERRRPGRLALYPLDRWMIAGASPPAVAPLAGDLARSGIRLTSAGGRDRRGPVPLVPGASVGALVAAGDVVVGAVGTVTWVDGDRVLAFGHPFLETGRSDFLMSDAYVFETVPNPLDGSSFKLAEPGVVQGGITADRTDGVYGRIGAAPAIHATARARDLARGTRSTVHVELAPDPRTAPQVGDLVQSEPLLRAADGLAGGTLNLRIRIASPALRRPLVYRNRFAAVTDVADVALGPLTRLLTALLGNSVRGVPIRSVRIDETLRPDVHAARIVGARVTPRRVRPGQRATLRLLVQPWRAARRTIALRIRIPRAIHPGDRRLRILANAPSGFAAIPPDLSEDLGTVTTAARARSLLPRIDAAAARGPGTRTARLLAAVRRATADRHDALRVLGPGEDADDPSAGTVVPVSYVISGGRAVPRIEVVGRRERPQSSPR
jgi:hypothetical protein